MERGILVDEVALDVDTRTLDMKDFEEKFHENQR